MMAAFKPNDMHYKMMGREFWKIMPETAKELIRPYLSVVPYDNDLTRIKYFYLGAFCSLQGIPTEYITGPIFKSTKVDIRKLFIASMVHIYCPHVYHQHSNEINLSKKGFVMHLSEALDIPESNTSGSIREVVAWEKDYDEFKDRVGAIVEKLKSIA